jgi:prevent-host-death family protein
MRAHTWTIAEAKAKFDELIEKAQSGQPQIFTRNGRQIAVIAAIDEGNRRSKRVGNLAEFFGTSPLRGSGLKIQRIQHQPRKIDV